MLTALSVRNVVLIERLDLNFGPGLTVLTGETGAGKSILLDSLGLATGARAEAGLVRASAEQASVVAVFAPPPGHPAYPLLQEQGIEAEDEIVLRRVVGRDGRSRAFANDAPVSAALLKRAGALLVEVQGQHDQLGLADPAGHAALLDAYGVPPPLVAEVTARFGEWRDRMADLQAARAAIAEALRDQEWLRHATDELQSLAPEDGEEERLAAERHRLQQAEKHGEQIAAALAELTPRDRRNAGPAATLRAAARALQRVAPSGGRHADAIADGASPGGASSDGGPAAPALAALERAEEALAEAETLLTRMVDEAETDPRLLERAEERLFALRAAARKHAVGVSELPGLFAQLQARLAALQTGESHVQNLQQQAVACRDAYTAACGRLSDARTTAAVRLERAMTRELAPLRLERSRFVVEIQPLDEAAWGAQGADQVRFLIATNPGQPPGPLARVASGGELSRLMLALKVVLAGGSVAPTLVFDEVDSGIGGATAAAVGERLARVAETVQVLLVTHSPQVAARGEAHLRVVKQTAKGRAHTRVEPLDGGARREEIARMLAGETITEAARAAADSLLGAA